MKPYYQDDMVTLYHADAMEQLENMGESTFDCVITDPPYTEEVHTNARSSKGSVSSSGAIDF
jgi:16S rRNA G966 N2-methylase RsmD